MPRTPVDCLLFRDPGGTLVGILNHYPVAIPPYEAAGNVNLWVREDRQRDGIGTTLVLEALARWSDVHLDRQSYTPAGRRLAVHCAALLNEGS